MINGDKKKKLIFIESDDPPEVVRRKIKNKDLVDLDLWVRTPDSEKLDEMQLKARLCGSKKTCIAVAEM